jgi:phage terminase large subunit-like protein
VAPRRAPSFRRIVLAIDPAGSVEGDETGILTAALDEADHGRVLVYKSDRYQPTDWARAPSRSITLCMPIGWSPRQISVAGWSRLRLRAADPNVSFRAVMASRGKVAPAEPVSALY